MKQYICFLLCCLLLLGMSGCGQEPSPNDDSQKSISRNDAQETGVLLRAGARVDGQVCFFLPNGEKLLVAADDAVEEAYLTPDRKHAVLYYGYDGFSVVDLETKEITVYSGPEKPIRYSLLQIKNDGIIVLSNFDTHVYHYGKKEPVIIANSTYDKVADNSVSLLHKERNGNLYLLPSGQDTPKVICQDENAEAVAVSNDGQLAVYRIDTDSSITAAMVYRDTHYDLGIGEPAVVFTKDQKLAVIIGLDKLWVIREGQEPESIKVSTRIDHRVFTEDGDLATMYAADVSAMYVCGTDHVEYITMDGDWQWVVDEPVNEFYVENGTMVYLTNKFYGGRLYRCQVKNGKLLDAECVAEDVIDFKLTENGQYLYYSKLYSSEENTYSFFCLKEGTDRALEIERNADSYMLLDFCFSPDGSCAYYYTGIARASFRESNTLKMWSYKSRESTIVSDNVLLPTLVTQQGAFVPASFNTSRVVTYPCVPYTPNSFGPEGFVFARLVDAEAPRFEWLHFDGKEIKQIQEPGFYGLLKTYSEFLYYK